MQNLDTTEDIYIVYDISILDNIDKVEDKLRLDMVFTLVRNDIVFYVNFAVF